MDNFFYNKTITRNNVLVLGKKNNNMNSFRAYVKEILKLNPTEETRNEIFCDYITGIYKFSVDRQYSAEKISTILNIGIEIFSQSLDKKMPIIESYQYLSQLLDKHDRQREPYFIMVFEKEDKVEILKYFRDTFYKHYTLYEVAMTRFIDYTLLTSPNFDIDLPDAPHLNEAVAADFNKFSYLGIYEPKVPIEEKLDQTVHGDTTEDHTKIDDKDAEINNSKEGHEHKEPEFVKGPEDVKIEARIDDTLNDFKSKLENLLKERDDQILDRIRPKSQDKGKKPAPVPAKKDSKK